jgi:hypothetical protein
MIQCGFQRLVLLNCAGYQRAELPLDAAVSLVAPNNTGKTSLINALQFLLIVDKRRMDFGAHDLERSKRFYFPDNSAYILLEVLLPEAGSVVLGCVGKGVSHDYEYFAYRGPLDVEDYRLTDGGLVAQPQLLAHLAERGRQALRYSPSEFAAMLYGGKRRGGLGYDDFTVFRLEHASQAEAFQRVLTRMLRLDRLTSREVKEHLLHIFRRDLPDASIDFKQEWDKAFAEVNAEREQYLAALHQVERIAQLERLQQERLQLRGKLCFYRPLIDQALLDWQAHYGQQDANLRSQCQAVQQAEEKLRGDQLNWARAQAQLQQREQSLGSEQRLQDELEQRFALIPERALLERNLHVTQQSYEAQVALVQQAQGRSAEQIRRERRSLEQQVQRLQRELGSLAGNLYQALQQVLTGEQLEALNRLCSAELLTLDQGAFSLQPEALRVALADWLQTPQRLQLPGLDLQLDSLTAQYSQRSAGELQQELDELTPRLAQLDEQARVADALEQARAHKARLEGECRQLQRDLEDFDRLATLRDGEAARQAALTECLSELAELTGSLAGAQAEERRLREQQRQLERSLEQLQEQRREIGQRRERRGDDDPLFDYLGELPQLPWLGSAELPLEQLAQALQQYQSDCLRLLRLEDSLRTLRAELHAGGLTKYQFADNPETEIRRIIEFAQQLPQEQQALERKARTAVVNVTACLRELRDGLHSFKAKMREFNRLISRRQLSDLAVFRIQPEDQQELVEAIDLLIGTAEQVSSGDTFELFNHGSVLDDDSLNRAKSLLIREGEARGCLKVEHLFRLQFMVGKAGHEAEAFADIDSAASNGTVLMAKLVTGLALLHLMQDKRHDIRALCYLDEALALDERNQKSLIDTASEFGFALIFASPAPLTTARYCVPITQHNGRNQISRRNWQVLEPLDELQADGGRA